MELKMEGYEEIRLEFVESLRDLQCALVALEKQNKDIKKALAASELGQKNTAMKSQIKEIKRMINEQQSAINGVDKFLGCLRAGQATGVRRQATDIRSQETGGRRQVSGGNWGRAASG